MGNNSAGYDCSVDAAYSVEDDASDREELGSAS